MSAPQMFQGLDSLMLLSRHEGVDIRRTLLRVLTDLYVQKPEHSLDEEQHFCELALRLIDEVDDATVAAVRARLAIYPRTPRAVLKKLDLPQPAYQRVPLAPSIDPAKPVETPAEPARALREIETEATPSIAPVSPSAAPTLSMSPQDASSLNAMFLAASSRERAEILYTLSLSPLRPSVRVDPRRAARAVIALEQAAMIADSRAFTAELADALILPATVAMQVVSDKGGETLACAVRALGMTSEIFQRVLLFLDPARGSSVTDVYRLARLYDTLGERAALIMLAAWRGASLAATRAKYAPQLYDDERHRARAATPQARPAATPDSTTSVPGLAERGTSRG